MKRHTFDITLKLRGPILTKSSSPGSFGLDATMARVAFGPDQNKPCIPGTHLEGKVREALLQLHNNDCKVVEPLFGKESAKDSDDEPSRGRLHIQDLVCLKESKAGDECLRLPNRHRISISPELGSVNHGALQAIEGTFAAGEDVEFRGQAFYYGHDSAKVLARLQQSLAFLTHIGANRGSGFGRVISVKVEPAENKPPLNNASLGAVPERLRLCIRPQGPLCIARHKIGGNLFESEDFIPGNMIAGAVVETWAALCDEPPGTSIHKLGVNDSARALLAKHFDHLRFRHAFAASKDQARPQAIPLSWVTAGKQGYDVVDHSAPILLQNDRGELQSPAFAVDWKDSKAARDACGIASPARELRVRTAIDYAKRTALRGENGEGGALFAWEVVHPYDDERQELCWHGAVDLEAVPDADRGEVAQQLKGLLEELGFVSKTKAFCQVEVTAENAPTAPTYQVGERLALVLQTPALVADPRFQTGLSEPNSGAISAPAMTEFYQAAWSQLSGGALELSHHFSRQRLAGGNYMARRFQRNKPYNPWLLTTEGSVFIFTVKDAEVAQTKLNTWLRCGLELPQWAEAAHGKDWRTNPYLPQNGFGEIALHKPNSDFPEPQATQFYPVTCA